MKQETLSARRIVWTSLVGVVALAGYFVHAYEKVLLVPDTEHALLLVTLTSRHQDGEAAASLVSSELQWSPHTRDTFLPTLRSVQWDALNGSLADLFTATFSWGDAERELFLASAAVFADGEQDLLGRIFVPDTYAFYRDASPLEVSEKLAAKAAALLAADPGAFFERIPDDTKEAVALYVRGETELLPDIVPLPPLDVVLRENAGRKELAFTTVYYNRGGADLKLRAESETAHMLGDMERVVYQEIPRIDSTVRVHEAGTFLWHEEHLHYHFSDFVDYTLAPVDVAHTAAPVEQKSTFCIRDVSRVDLPDVPRTEAAYKVCGRERQGVSVGWGDAYFNTYPDQYLDVTDLPSGTYRLTFHANPRARFEESEYGNNVSSATIYLDQDAGTVTVIETDPRELPSFEHIHTEDIYI